MKTNTVSSYLLYAMGEILLVVIGILIAVSINNWNEGQKKNKELENILAIVKSDLENDLKEMDKILKGHEAQRPLFYKVLNDSITRQDYENNKSWAFLILGYPELSIDKRGFHLLSNYNDNTDNMKDSLSTRVIDFYTERLLEIKVDDDFRAEDYKANYAHWKENFDWWAKYIRFEEIDGFVDYALNDQDYKNRVATIYFLTYDVYLPELAKFKEGANKIITAIEKRLAH